MNPPNQESENQGAGPNNIEYQRREGVIQDLITDYISNYLHRKAIDETIIGAINFLKAFFMAFNTINITGKNKCFYSMLSNGLSTYIDLHLSGTPAINQQYQEVYGKLKEKLSSAVAANHITAENFSKIKLSIKLIISVIISEDPNSIFSIFRFFLPNNIKPAVTYVTNKKPSIYRFFLTFITLATIRREAQAQQDRNTTYSFALVVFLAKIKKEDILQILGPSEDLIIQLEQAEQDARNAVETKIGREVRSNDLLFEILSCKNIYTHTKVSKAIYGMLQHLTSLAGQNESSEETSIICRRATGNLAEPFAQTITTCYRLLSVLVATKVVLTSKKLPDNVQSHVLGFLAPVAPARRAPQDNSQSDALGLSDPMI